MTGLEAAEEFSRVFANQLVSASGHILRTSAVATSYNVAVYIYCVVVMNQCIIVIVTQDYSQYNLLYIWQHNSSVCILLYTTSVHVHVSHY